VHGSNPVFSINQLYQDELQYSEGGVTTDAILPEYMLPEFGLLLLLLLLLL